MVDDATARRLVDEYQPVVRACAAYFPRAEFEDLVAVGLIAVVQAKVSYDDKRECSFGTWARRLIRQRMGEHMARVRELEQPDEHIEHHVNGRDPEDNYLRAFIKESAGRLSPRHRVIIDARLRGYTFKEIGDSIGISDSVVEQQEKQALRLLREWARDDV